MDDASSLGRTKTSPRRADTRAPGQLRTIDRYRILGPLGEGGMGVVYAAYDPELDRKVAIKLLRGVENQAAQLRLVREAKAMARLSHPNVVRIYDAGAADGQVFLTMELIDGTTVRQWLAEEQRGTQAIVDTFVAAGRGLAAAHAAGLVHRDFKPENVLLADDGRVCVADFGIASSGPLVASGNTSHRASGLPLRSVTTTGTIIGTPGYMAPEQIEASEVGPTADQFGFCVALYQALFGIRPFAGRMLDEILANIRAESFESSQTGRDVPRRWCSAIRRGLRMDPAARHADMDALLEELTFDVGVERRRNRRAVLAVVLSGVGLLAARSLHAAPEPCQGARADFSATWSNGTRAETVESLEPSGSTATAAVLRSIDAFGERWVAAHEQMCRAHQAGTLSPKLLDASMTCLEGRRDSVGSLVRVALAGKTSAAHVAEAAARLPRISDCTERRLLAEEVLGPVTPEAAEAAESIRGELRDATVLHNTGSTAAAVKRLEDLSLRADLQESPLVAAEVALATGRLAMVRNEIETSRRALEDASALAIGSGLHRIAAEAEARLLFVEAVSENGGARTPSDRVAKALIHRTGNPPWLRALWLNNMGVALGQAGDAVAARTKFEAAFAIADASAGISAADRSGYASNLAKQTNDPEARDALLVRAAKVLADALGSGHPAHVDARYTRAIYSEDLTWAAEALDEICPAFSRQGRDPLWQQTCWWSDAELKDSLGDPRAAAEALDAASRAFDDVPNLDPFEEALLERLKGYRSLLEEDPRSALSSLDASHELLAPKKELPWVAKELDAVTVLRARAKRSLGRLSEEHDALEELVTRYDAAAVKPIDPAVSRRIEQARRLLQESRSTP